PTSRAWEGLVLPSSRKRASITRPTAVPSASRTSVPSRSLRIMATPRDASDDAVAHPAFRPAHIEVIRIRLEPDRRVELRDDRPGDAVPAVVGSAAAE